MNCVLKMELSTSLKEAQEALERFDTFFREKYPDLNSNAPEAFMSAWNKAKTAKHLLLSINLENGIEL